MKLTIAVVLAVLTRATAGLAQVVAFENVNVIPMDRNRVLERQTVVIRDGRIAQMFSYVCCFHPQVKTTDNLRKLRTLNPLLVIFRP